MENRQLQIGIGDFFMDITLLISVVSGVAMVISQLLFWPRVTAQGFNTQTLLLGMVTPIAFAVQWCIEAFMGTASGSTLLMAFAFAVGNMGFLYGYGQKYAKERNFTPIRVPKLFWGILGIELILILGGLFYFLPNPKFVEYFMAYFTVLNVVTVPILLWIILGKPPIRQV
jgi:hypothetical protein